MPEWLLNTLGDYGYGFIFLAVFLNNAGLPIPGDVTVLGGGLLVENGNLSLGPVVATATLACFLGGTTGYWLGRRVGRRTLRKARWLGMTPEKMKQMDRFFRRYGPKMVFFARFVALVHPVTGLLAGVGKMPLKPFLAYNLAGAFAYAGIYTLAGYFFGASWDVLKLWLGRGALYSLLAVLVFLLAAQFLRGPLHRIWLGFSKKT